MNILSVEGLTKYYGELLLFDSIDVQLNSGQKTALIAKNGTGKTTLMNVLSGKDSYEAGKITLHRDITLGYLEQDPVMDPENTVLEQIFDSSDELTQTIKAYEEAVEKQDNEIIQQLVEKIDALNAWDFETRIKQILSVFKITNYQQKVGQLSGGQRKRLALASFLIKEPELLFMDEPTNHLDLEMVEWLEDYLTRTKITLLMVTHDRYFLDRVCDNILELDNKSMYRYAGNFSYYLEKREERLEIEAKEVEKAQSLYKKEIEWIRRMPKARGTKAKYRVDAFQETKEKAFSGRKEKDLKINVQTARLGKKIIELKNISKKFSDKLTILNEFNYTFSPYEKVGIIGKNGTGKSTFLNILTETMPPDSGEIIHGETLKVGYFRQDGLNFREDQKVIDVVREVSEVVTLGDGSTLGVSQFLTHFMFEPEVQHMHVSKLSGGEKRRLYLVTVLMQNPNFLILDEPTNDLDIMTLSVLEDYLADFAGCVMIVSHDRFFLDRIVDHLFVFKGQGEVKDYPGNYTQYRDTEKQEERAKQKVEKSTVKEEQPKNAPAKKKKLSYNEQRELDQIEKDMPELEKRQAEIEEEMVAEAMNHVRLQELTEELEQLKNDLEEKEMRWLELND